MRGKVANAIIGLLGLLLLGVLGGYLVTSRQHLTSGGASPLPLDQDSAVNLAVRHARDLGLRGEPTAITAKRMSFGHYSRLTGFIPGSDASKYGLDPVQMVWVVSLKGAGKWTGPGQVEGLCPECDEPETFDKLSLVLNESTGERLAAATAGPGEPLPVDAVGGSLEDGGSSTRAEPTAERTRD